MGKRGPAPKFSRFTGGGLSDSTSPLQPPGWLQGDALDEWRRLSPWLAERGLASPTDRGLLVSYCVSWGLLVQSTKDISDGGLAVVGHRGRMVMNPAARVLNDASANLLRIASRFGFSPADRSGLKLSDTVGMDDPREKLFFVVDENIGHDQYGPDDGPNEQVG